MIYWQDGVASGPFFANNAYEITYEPTGNFLDSERKTLSVTQTTSPNFFFNKSWTLTGLD